ncbi:MAG: DNA primase [Candidatus Pacebacteria bacterium]|nr:DNA primase [Candidatus Paceibacterota bacterium]
MTTVEQIKQKLSVTEVIGGYIKLEKAGANFKARCPFHNEKTPSFFISPERGSYYCFGCGMKGDIFSFVQEFEKVDFMGALKILADKAGVEITRERPEARTEREKLFSILEEATIFFQSHLEDELGTNSAKKYLTGRGLTEDTIKTWRLGYAPAEWQALNDHLKKIGSSKDQVNGFGEAEIEKVGLIKRAENSNRFYDRFRGRVIFPLFDPSSRVIGYSGRVLEGAEIAVDGGVKKEAVSEAKYLNSPDTPLFNKSEVLYGYDRAKQAIRQKDYSLLVEGQMDLLMAHQAGFTNAVASSGTALTADHLRKLNQLSSNIMIAYDADKAGLNASVRAWSIALSLGMEVKIAELPKGQDPAELILNNLEVWKETLRKAKHVIDFNIDIVMADAGGDANTKGGKDEKALWKEIEKNVLPYVASLPSAIQQSHYLGRIADVSGIPLEALKEEFHKLKQIMAGAAQAEILKNTPEKNDHEKSLAKENSKAGFVYHPDLRLIKAIIAWQESGSEIDVQSIKARVDSLLKRLSIASIDETFGSAEEKADLASEAEMIYAGSKLLTQDIDTALSRLEEDAVKELLSKAMAELHRAEQTKDLEKAKTLFAECHSLSTELASVQKRSRASG